mmetsp:Transcript_64374/g.88418  ORF Transcript_64374/g.88418 Transcript_64374/m.88418 type:complete len:337 (+) Transcript_64374:411-1421(+)
MSNSAVDVQETCHRQADDWEVNGAYPASGFLPETVRLGYNSALRSGERGSFEPGCRPSRSGPFSKFNHGAVEALRQENEEGGGPWFNTEYREGAGLDDEKNRYHNSTAVSLAQVDRRCFRGASDQKYRVLPKDSAGVWGIDVSFYPLRGRDLLSCVRWKGSHCGRLEQEETREKDCRLSGLDNCLSSWGCKWRDGSHGVSATGCESENWVHDEISGGKWSYEGLLYRHDREWFHDGAGLARDGSVDDSWYPSHASNCRQSRLVGSSDLGRIWSPFHELGGDGDVPERKDTSRQGGGGFISCEPELRSGSCAEGQDQHAWLFEPPDESQEDYPGCGR